MEISVLAGPFAHGLVVHQEEPALTALVQRERRGEILCALEGFKVNEERGDSVSLDTVHEDGLDSRGGAPGEQENGDGDGPGQHGDPHGVTVSSENGTQPDPIVRELTELEFRMLAEQMSHVNGLAQELTEAERHMHAVRQRFQDVRDAYVRCLRLTAGTDSELVYADLEAGVLREQRGEPDGT